MPDRLGEPKLSEVVSAAALLFGLDPDDLRGMSRQRPIVAARQTTWLACRMVTSASYPDIADYFGGRDHSTIMSGVNRSYADHERVKEATRIIEAIETRGSDVTIEPIIKPCNGCGRHFPLSVLYLVTRQHEGISALLCEPCLRKVLG